MTRLVRFALVGCLGFVVDVAILYPVAWLGAGWVLGLLWVRTLFRFYARVAKSNFPFVECALAPLALPLFVLLLYRSWFQHRMLKQVSWKGRSYRS